MTSHHASDIDIDIDIDIDDAEPLPTPPTPLIHLAPGRLITDVDDEIFLLYTLHSKPHHHGGLGYVNHSSDKLYISLDPPHWTHALTDRNLSGHVVPIHQHVTSLRSSKGDTGSVLWRSTVELALRFHNATLFNRDLLQRAVVLELGSGTAALAAMVAQTCQSWLATDQPQLVPLMAKNLATSPTAKPTALDWFDLHNPASPHTAQLRTSSLFAQLSHAGAPKPPDLVVCCDCIYNPALFAALISTMNVVTHVGSTMVLVTCEMRSHECLHEFLTAWLASHAAWTVVSLEHRFAKGFAAFVGWKQMLPNSI